MKKLGTILAILALTGCIPLLDIEAKPSSMAPKPLFFKNLPQGNDTYSVGFRQGCYNAIGNSGWGMMRLYEEPFNADEFVADELYDQGYRHGDRHCGIYVNRGIIL